MFKIQRTKLYIMFHALIAIFGIHIFLCLCVLSVCISACNKHQTFIFTCPEKILTFIIIENAPILTENVAIFFRTNLRYYTQTKKANKQAKFKNSRKK